MATQIDTHLANIVGANISRARRFKGLTQQDVAGALATSTSRVSGWERGLHLPSRRQQQPLAELLFGGDVSALYRETEAAA
jgi:transcriptional regulator with XRE-family HTH domain